MNIKENAVGTNFSKICFFNTNMSQIQIRLVLSYLKFDSS